MSTSIVEVKNLTKIYKGKGDKPGVTALNNISLTIQQGEVFGLLGVNGAGKTTLSSILATLHPPTSGTILFQGTPIYDDLLRYRKNLGFCPQKQNLDMFLSVEDNLIFAGKYFLMRPEKIKERVAFLMERFSLQKYANFDVAELSGGNKQRVLLARALIHEPRIVILDEPTVGLDPDIRRSLWKLIADLKSMGITVILTTHYLDEAEVLSDRVCILHKGKILLIESVHALKERHGKARLEDIFLTITQEVVDE